MCILYKNIKLLCDMNNILPSKLCADIGISKGIITDLKMGRKSGVSAVTADKIASYFNVSVGDLLNEGNLTIGKKISKLTANNLRRAREAAGLTVEKAAASIGVDVAEIIRCESPACHLRQGDKLLEDLCTLYKTTPYSVLSMFDPETSPTDEDMKLMLFGGFSSVTDEMLEEVKRYAEYLISSENAEKPAAEHGNRLYEIVSIFSKLSDDNRSKLLELANLFLTAQSKTEESK